MTSGQVWLQKWIFDCLKVTRLHAQNTITIISWTTNMFQGPRRPSDEHATFTSIMIKISIRALNIIRKVATTHDLNSLTILYESCFSCPTRSELVRKSNHSRTHLCPYMHMAGLIWSVTNRTTVHSHRHSFQPMNGENQLLVTNETVEFEE